MKVLIFLLSLISADLIGFNRYRNNLDRHVEGRMKSKSNSSHYYRLQMILAKIAKGDTKSLKFAKNMMEQIKNEKKSSKNENRRLNNYLQRLR